jgi:AcrR family transcriptional regulator
MTAGSTVIGDDAVSTRERILREASRLFAARGYYGSSTRDIAAAVGVQQPSLFHHFESKQAILQELLGYSLEDSVAVAEYLAKAEGSASARLYRFLVEDLRFLMDSPYDLRSIFSGDLLSEEEFHSWGALDDRLHNAVADLIRQGIEAGEFVEIDVGFATHAVLGMMLETIRERSLGGTVPAERPRRAAEFVLRGFLGDPRRIETVAKEACALANLPAYRDVGSSE